MIKLTNAIYEVSEKVERKIQDMSDLYSETVREAELYGREVPPPPTYKMKSEDFNVTYVDMWIRPSEISVVTSNVDGETIVVAITDREYIVKESPEDIIKMIGDD